MTLTQTVVGALPDSLALTGTAGADYDITLQSSNIHPDGDPTVEPVKAMGVGLKANSDSRICIEIFASARLRKEKQGKAHRRTDPARVIDLAGVSLGPFNNVLAEMQVPSWPDIFRSLDHMRTVMDGPIGPEILDAVSAADLVGLTFCDGGSRSLCNSKNPITSMADMAGKKVRVMHSDMLAALCANATPMPCGEVWSSIQTGVIDGAKSNWPSRDTSDHANGARHDTLDRHLIVPDSDKTPFLQARVPVCEKHVTDDKLKSMVERSQATELHPASPPARALLHGPPPFLLTERPPFKKARGRPDLSRGAPSGSPGPAVSFQPRSSRRRSRFAPSVRFQLEQVARRAAEWATARFGDARGCKD